MADKKAPRGCDARGLKAKNNSDGVSHTALAFQAQMNFLARRVGALDPALLATVAALCFGEVTR